jgi:PAS domain-containing protein
MKTQVLSDEALSARVAQVFGRSTDSMTEVESRAHQHLEDMDVVVWEGDASTFQFSFVGEAAVRLLGYPRTRWTTEPTFWADSVVHPDDRNDAIAFCALATGQCRDHDFVYRAVAEDGRVVWLHDIVKVIPGPRGIPERLRGVMIDVTATRPEDG